MVDLEEINSEILKLESKDTTFATCERLAWLYVVKDHLTPASAKAKTGVHSGSEFLRAASGVDVDALLAILNDHLEVVRILYPAEYAEILERVESLHQTHESKN